MDQIQETLSRINIVDIIGQHIKLVKKGNNYLGLCPFHNEKTPSFNVSADKGVYYCFGCHASGNAFTFLEQYEKLSFKEALEILAEKAGVKLKKIEKIDEIKKDKTIDILQHMQNIFIQELSKSIDAQNYIKNRNFTQSTIEEFGIGYAPNSWNAQYIELLQKGFTHGELLEGGVIKQSEKKENEYYDKFRHRIMIPIYNATNIIVGFSGRVIDPHDEPKYINSNESSVFKKSHLLFNLNKAKEHIKKSNEVIVMEGHLDVIKAYQAGTKNTVAAMGTAFGDFHANILKRYCDNIVFCFDNDNAGLNATYKNIEYAQKHNMNIKIIKIEKYKDPDECIDKDIEYWYKILEEKKELMEFVFDTIEKIHNKTNPNGKNKIIDTILPFIIHYPNAITQDHYLRQASQRYDISIDILKNKLKTTELSFLNTETEIKTQSIPKNNKLYLMSLIIEYIDKWAQIEKKPELDIFENTPWQEAYNVIKEGKTNYIEIETNIEDEQNKNLLREMIFYIRNMEMKYNKDNLIKEIKNLVNTIKNDDKKKRMSNILNQMKQINDKQSNDYQILLKQYSDILKS